MKTTRHHEIELMVQTWERLVKKHNVDEILPAMMFIKAYNKGFKRGKKVFKTNDKEIRLKNYTSNV